MRQDIHLKDGSSEPSDSTRFIIAKNGLFVRKQNDWVDAVVPAKGIDGLEPEIPRAALLLPPLTSTVFAKAVLFFNEVYLEQGTEAAVLLHYHPKHGWDLTVPEQTATAAHVNYAASERIPGYRCVGTMHSHCAMSAFHSGTDTYDEAAQDGVHITIGCLNRFPLFGMDAELVINGSRFKLPHEHIMYVKEEPPEQRTGLFGLNAKRDTLYSVPFDVVRDWTVPPEWVGKVQKEKPAPLFGGWLSTEEQDYLFPSRDVQEDIR